MELKPAMLVSVCQIQLCSSTKYPYSPHGRFFVLHPPPPFPLATSSLASYFASKILTFKTPLPLGISNNLPWGAYRFFSGTVHSPILIGQSIVKKGHILIGTDHTFCVSQCVQIKVVLTKIQDVKIGVILEIVLVICRSSCYRTEHTHSYYKSVNNSIT